MTQTDSTSQDKLERLHNVMDSESLDGFIVPRADEYQGEFVAPYAERLKWLTGFTGSAGAAIILKNKAVVMSDGRYTIQLKNQVDKSCYHTGDYTKTRIGEWISRHAAENAVIGYDPMLLTGSQVESIEKPMQEKGMTLKPVPDNLIDRIWDNQPEKPKEKVILFPEKIAGKTLPQKLEIIQKTLADDKAVGTVLNLPDSIAWLLNIRGHDADHIPQALSTVIVYTGKDRPVEWFIDPDKVPDAVHTALGNHVVIYRPEDMRERLRELAWTAQSENTPAALDFTRTPIWFKNELEEAGAKVINAKDPCIHPKSLKNESEQKSIRETHIVDGVAMVKLLHWLDTTALSSNADEMMVEEKLESFRREHPAFKEPSFSTIAGSGPNGAIVHYRATPETTRKLEEGALLLLDSGGQYFSKAFAGTTDITRTVAIGTPTEDMRRHFTLVLKGHISLASAHLPEGSTGAQADTLARHPLWNAGLDFAHGTGHGVGCYLSVHEEAANISPRGNEALEPGMLLSNEPGYYKEEAYGIRIENLILVHRNGTCEGTGKDMLYFETLSYAPIDQNLIDAALLTKAEKTWLNNYHRRVFETLSPHLDETHKDWLEKATQNMD